MSADYNSIDSHPFSLDDLSDAELIGLSRDGRTDAYAELYTRHSYVARRLARHLGQREEAEDVVAEAFAQILDLLLRGKGPDESFRAYLFTTIRHESGRRAKVAQRVMTTDDDSQIDVPVAFGAGELDLFERTAVKAAYESLPERWQRVLWHLDVEGRKPLELADTLGMKANTVSALVYRARTGLREAYLQQHVAVDHDHVARSCGDVRASLAAVVRRTASAKEQDRVWAHVDGCADCSVIVRELQDVNRDLGAVAAPAVLATATVGGGALVAGKVGGGMLANLVATTKGAAVAVLVPAAAVTATTVAVMSSGTSGSAVAASPVAESVVHVAPRVVSPTEPVRREPNAVAARSTASGGAADVPRPAAQPVAAAPSTTTAPQATPGRPDAATVVKDVTGKVANGQLVGAVKNVADGLDDVVPGAVELVDQLVPRIGG